MIYNFYLFINSNLICLFCLFKLRHLLHDRIDPTVELLRKTPRTLKIKRVQRYKTTTSVPPKGTPSWCLNREALERFNRPTNNIPVYDYDTEDIQYDDDSSHNTDNENKNGANSNKTKRKSKKKSKQKKGKKHKKSKN